MKVPDLPRPRSEFRTCSFVFHYAPFGVDVLPLLFDTGDSDSIEACLLLLLFPLSRVNEPDKNS